MSWKPEGHTLARTRLSAEKFAGLVTQWKGKYGWIKPSQAIEHEKANMKNGKLFCTMNDIFDGSGSLHPGAPCEFHLYEDESGLGAEEVVETGPPDPSAIPPEDQGKSKGKGGGWGGDKGFGKAPFSNGWGGDKGFSKMMPPKGFSKGWSEPYGFGGKGGGKWDGGWGGKGWGGGGGGGKKNNIRKENAASTVWLGGLPAGLSKEEIQTNFEAAGSVKMVELIKWGKEGFVIFSTPEEAMSAIAMFNGAAINGSAIQVDTWNKKETTA